MKKKLARKTVTFAKNDKILEQEYLLAKKRSH